MGIYLNIKQRQIPDQKLYNSIRNETYKKPIPDRSQHLRCDTGEMHDGKPFVILVAPDKLEAKKLKYPHLRVLIESDVHDFLRSKL
ncbi:hypothetical protein GCM10027347_44500 [Larkinella harenae]